MNEQYKPILFNTEMVQAIIDGRKTMTRRVVRKKYSNTDLRIKTDKYGMRLVEWQNDAPPCTLVAVRDVMPPYKRGDILWVRETFKIDYLSDARYQGRIRYRASGYEDFSYREERHEMMLRLHRKPGWVPNENMPKEAARIFLRVTGARAERLWSINEDDAAAEGCAVGDQYGANSTKSQTAKQSFMWLWQRLNDFRNGGVYAWAANPWVWVYTFELVDKPEGWLE